MEFGIPVRGLDFTLTETYGAGAGVDEVFFTGTFPLQIHVREIDGRTIGSGKCGTITGRNIQQLYMYEDGGKGCIYREDRTRAEIQRDLEAMRPFKL